MLSSKSSMNFSSFPVSEPVDDKRWQTQCMFNIVLDFYILRNLAATPFSSPVITDAPSDTRALRSARSSCNWFCIRFLKPSDIDFALALVSSDSETKSVVCRNFVSGSPLSMLWQLCYGTLQT